MQIKEVQEKLKISSYTLRYYEKMGLIQPYRDENGYRNYNEEDIHKIDFEIENRTPINCRQSPKFSKYFDVLWKELGVNENK